VSDLPSGTVTFLFTDVEGSTRLWEEHPAGMSVALAVHDAILRAAVAEHRGYVVKATGDGFHAVFATAHDALDAAVTMQRGLAAEAFEDTPRLRVRMGIHTCEAQHRDGDYYGSEVNRAARLMSVAHGDQIVTSLATSTLVRESGVELVDLGEHRLRDLTNLERVFQARAPGLPREFPALRSLDTLPGNLPRQVTTFVGREAEITSLSESIHSSSLVTLTGVGGVGKTRLALQVAAEVVPGFRDGAWFVELAGLRDPEAVPNVLVVMFGLQPRSGSSPTDALVEFLAGKDMLLVLDNCEHLLRAAADLVDQVVRGCPGVRVLATSRESLNVGGERIVGVASLEVPDDGLELDTMARCDAVTLFVQRAQAVRASFVLDATNAGAVAQICRRLDGIALAIELAAARVAMLTPMDVARRLDQRFRLLAGGQRSSVERHQTLRGAIDWSYELLSEHEQLLLTRLSVFSGGFSLEAAEVVASGGLIESDDVFELLAALVARSLVVADTEGIDTRYRLLETIRQYAQEHLDGGGNVDELRGGHGAYFATFTEEAIKTIAGPDGITWEHRLRREFDNIRVALTWAIETRNVDIALRLLAVWDNGPGLAGDLGLLSTARWSCDAALDLPGAPEHPRYPTVLSLAAFLAWQQGDQERALQLCDDALDAARRLRAEAGYSLLFSRINIALAQGHLDDAVDHALHAVEVTRADGHPVPLAIALSQSAMTQTMAGNSTAARRDAEEIIGIAHRLANPHLIEGSLGIAAFALGDSEPERALSLAREAIALNEPGAHTLVWAIAGDLADRNGQQHDALIYFAEAIDALLWFGNRVQLGNVIDRVASILCEDEPQTAAVLQGVGDARAPGYTHSRHAIEVHARATESLAASLDANRRHELYTEGMTMTDAQAVDFTKSAISRYLADRAVVLPMSDQPTKSNERADIVGHTNTS
jgi:predicted ATPase/class 3 adenylate cyclase